MRRLLLVLFAAAVALAPLPFGSKYDWAFSPLGGIVGGLLVGIAALAGLDRDWRRRAFVRFDALLIPSVLFCLVVIWGLVQLSGWTPTGWATSISASAPLGLSETRRSIAFDSELHLTALMRLLTYAGVFVLAVTLGHYASDARRILATIVIVAVATTLYAMAAQAINLQARITHFAVWVPAEEYFTGTFMSSNHYATYCGIAALAALVLAFRPASRQAAKQTAQERWRQRLAVLSGLSGVWFALALVLCMGVVLSSSRGGAISLTFGLIAFAVFYVRGATRIVVVSLIVLVVAAVVLLAPSGERLAMRTATLFAQGESGRELLFPMALSAISLRPLTGWGMNVFEKLYSVFQPPSLIEYFDKIHNTYLELALDLGVPIALTLLVAVGWIAGQCAVGFITRRRDRELAGLGVFATAVVAFHSLFDYPLQIPAVACCYFAIVGIAWAQSGSSQLVEERLSQS